MSDPLELDADLVISGPLSAPAGGTLPAGVLALAAARLDISAGFDLPGVQARAQRFGADAVAGFSLNRAGNLLGGYLLLQPPVPRGPEAIAVALQGPMPGGGFLEHDRAHDTYRGAIGVDLGFVVVSGYASISVGDPISVVALLSASFRPPIQLSFGFTLVGVGGVVGINRGVDRDALQEATFSGAISAMFFPTDPIGEADKVLAAIDGCFPVRPGEFFGGPMLKLGWGTPTIVSATIAVIAGTSGVLILGKFAISLPCEDVPFAVLQVTVLGVIDASGVSVFGSLVNSHIGPITVSGDAAFVLTSGPSGTMALSVGGFHPDYKPPPGIRPMQRIGAEMSMLPFATVRIEGYVAVTSDSIQFGGSVRLKADVVVASIEGSAAFDALILFSPFRFTVDFRGSIAVRAFGVRICSVGLSAKISGPGRWLIKGEVTVGILWWDLDVPIELSWGDDPPEPLATERPLELLRAEVRKQDNWQATGYGDLGAWVELCPADPQGSPSGVLSPVGGLSFLQHAVPLDREMTRVGGRRLPAPVTVTMQVDGAPPNRDARFPAGHFFDRSREELLSGQGLVPAHAGVAVDAGTRVVAKTLTKGLDFEDFILDPDAGLLRRRGVLETGFELAISVAGGAASKLRTYREAAVVVPAFVVNRMVANG